jgi:hypothetical protein
MRSRLEIGNESSDNGGGIVVPDDNLACPFASCFQTPGQSMYITFFAFASTMGTKSSGWAYRLSCYTTPLILDTLDGKSSIPLIIEQNKELAVYAFAVGIVCHNQ